MKKLLVFLLFLLGYCTAFSLDSLHFTFPTPDAKLVAGSDTLISWEGIAQTDSVKIEYSLDNGKTWILLSQQAMGMNYIWKNIPNKVGAGYLIRLIHKGEIITKLDEPYIEWQKTYGGSSYDQLTDIQELAEGGFIAVGSTESGDFDLSVNKGDKDIWLLKVDSQGNIIFSKTFGGSKQEVPNFILPTNEGGYITGGVTFSKDFDFKDHKNQWGQFLIKFDKNGIIEWEKNYSNGAWPIADIKETDDGGYIFVCDSEYVHPCSNKDNYGPQKILIKKIDKYGKHQWSKSYGGNLPDVPSSIEKTKDGGYIVVGKTQSNCGDVTENKGGTDVWVLKLDKNGNLEWQKTYGGSGDFDNAFAIKQTISGDYLIFGSASSNDYDITDSKGGGDIWIFKISSTGGIIWSKSFGGSGLEQSNQFSKTSLTNDNGFIFSCSTASKDGDVTYNHDGTLDGWFVKIDYDGNIKYQRTSGGSDWDSFSTSKQTKDQGYIIAGFTYSVDGDVSENKDFNDGWIIKLGVNYQTIDTLTTTFSIVAPQPQARDVDMGKVFLGEWRDSTVADFVYNIGSYKFRVDSIYIRGADKTAFSLIGGFPKYNVEPDSGKPAKFKFTPNRVGMHNAEIIIITQTDTLIQNIIGEGLKKRILISAELKPFSDLICENSTSSTIEIKSTGGDTLRIKALNLNGTDKADFSINEALPINLAPDSSKTIAIGFKSNVPGIKTAALEIKSNADPDSVLLVPLTARKDSIALVTYPTLIDLGTLFPKQTKDTSFIVSNLGTIKADGKVTLTNNLTCANPTFTIDSGGAYKLDFTFSGLPADGNINEKITVWDDVCKYSREVIITGKVVSPHLLGFSAAQCKSYSNEYKLTLNNNTSNRLKITRIAFDKNPQLFEIDPSLVFPIAIEPFSTNNEVKVAYQDNSVQKFKTAVNSFTDNKFLPVLTDTIFAETVGYFRSTDGLINDTIHNENNPFAVSYDSASLYGKNKFTYSIKVNESADVMEYLTELSDLEVVINYNRNVLGADFDLQKGNVKVRLSDDIKDYYSIKSAKETKNDELNSQIVVNLENTDKPITTKDAYKLFEIDFNAYLGKEGLSNEQNSDKSRSAVISHLINSTDKCISYETANNAEVTIEKLCVDEIRSIKITENPSDHFYLSDVIPQPMGSIDATIEYGLGFECQVTLTIYDISGAIILTPINEIQKAGTHKQTISRKTLSAGAYFIEMKAGQFKETKKIIVE
ncbi:MAG: choice-of-anchor D domain-containing protein [bacterium]